MRVDWSSVRTVYEREWMWTCTLEEDRDHPADLVAMQVRAVAHPSHARVRDSRFVDVRQGKHHTRLRHNVMFLGTRLFVFSSGSSSATPSPTRPPFTPSDTFSILPPRTLTSPSYFAECTLRSTQGGRPTDIPSPRNIFPPSHILPERASSAGSLKLRHSYKARCRPLYRPSAERFYSPVTAAAVSLATR
jgi:hypothetical protein